MMDVPQQAGARARWWRHSISSQLRREAMHAGRGISWTIVAASFVVAAAAAPSVSLAHTGHGGSMGDARNPSAAPIDVAQHPWGAGYFPNVPLVTHEGKTVRFYDDLLKGKAVVINVIYTPRRPRTSKPITACSRKLRPICASWPRRRFRAQATSRTSFKKCC